MSAKLTISELDLFGYLKDFETWRSPLSDFYVKTKKCLILGAFDEEGNASGLLLAEKAEETELLYLSGEDSSVKKMLVKHLMGHMPTGKLLRWRTEENSEEEGLAKECGFRYECALHIFRSVSSDDPVMKEVLPEYEKLCTQIERLGYETVSFEHLSTEALDQIRYNAGDEYAPGLNPGVLMDDRIGGFSPEMSFACLKDGRVTAYTIVRAPGQKRCIFEIVCAARSQRGTGAFLLPIIGSIKAMQDQCTESAVCAIYEHNEKALTMVTRRLGRLLRSHSVRRHYVYRQ